MFKNDYIRYFFSIAAVFFFVLAGQARGEGFLAGFTDVPLMPQLEAVPETALSFDTPEGSIAEIVATGNASPEAVTRFYQETLPQLGWVRVGALSFEREGALLTVTVAAMKESVSVQFKLAPKAAK